MQVDELERRALERAKVLLPAGQRSRLAAWFQAPFAVPRYLAFPRSLPRTGSGKVQKEALKAGPPCGEDEYDRSAYIT